MSPTPADCTAPTSDRARRFDEHMNGLIETFPPRNARERALVERAAQAFDVHEQVVQLQAARISSNIADAERRDAAALERRAQQLFHWRHGPIEQYGCVNHRRGSRRTSNRRVAADPETLIWEMERSLAGCQWLLNQWAELRAVLERGAAWEPQHTLKCLRLLGRHGHEAAVERDVFDILVASWSLHPKRAHPFCEIGSELRPGQYRGFVRMLRATRTERIVSPDPETARRMLLRIVEGAMERLAPVAAAAEGRAERDAALRADCLSFDFSAEGERLRRAEERSLDTFLSAMDQLITLRQNVCERETTAVASGKDAAAAECGSEIGDRQADLVNAPASHRHARTPQPAQEHPPADGDAELEDAEILKWIPDVRRAPRAAAVAGRNAHVLDSDYSCAADHAALAALGVTNVTNGFLPASPVSPLPETG